MPARKSPAWRRLGLEIGALVLAGLAALALRSWVVGLYLIPSASMLPRLMPGDYLLVEKWPFALQGGMPRRGDVVVVRVGGTRYVKRVIGLPGDRVALKDDRLSLDGRRVPRWRVADFLFRPSPAMTCRRPEPQPDGPPLCRVRRLREMPAARRFYDTIASDGGAAHDFAASVPPGHLFLLGDNRDRSADSRSVLGMVPQTALVGRAGVIVMSLDPQARLADPGGWWQAVRWERIGARP